MSTWTQGELGALGAATELRISTHLPDGTLRPAVPIWVVRAGDDIYVRSYRGTDGTWFQHATADGTAHIHAGNVDSEVTVRRTGTAVRTEIDEAYRTKYAGYGHAYTEPMTADVAAATTLQLTPAHGKDLDHDKQP
jgi:hypothetical protein